MMHKLKYGGGLRLVSLALAALAIVLSVNAYLRADSWSLANAAATISVTIAICFAGFLIASNGVLAHNYSTSKKLARFRVMFDHLPQSILLFSRKKRLVFANRSYSKLYGIAPELLKQGMTEEELIALRKTMGLPVYTESESITVERDRDGELVQSQVWRLPDGHMVQFEHISTGGGGWIAQHRDVSSELRHQQEVRDATQYLETVLQSVPSAIIVKNAQTLAYEYVNNAVQKMNGWHYRDILGKHASDLFSEEIAKGIEAHDRQTLLLPPDKVMEREETQALPNGKSRIINSKRLLVRDSKGSPWKLLTVVDDITARREAEQKIAFMANHDALTELKNRAWFNNNITAVNSKRDDDRQIALVLLDLYCFKNVNDTFGHAAGDMTLRIFATKIQNQFGRETAIARLGGDEFAIIVDDGRMQENIVKCIKALILDVANPMDFEDHRIAVNCSVGVAFATAGELGSDDLFSQADIALYEAKSLGKATYCIFTPELGGKKLKAKAMEMRLRHAIESDHLHLYYQPIVDAKTGVVVSMEALVRWFDPVQGMIPPNDFIPLAEETGLIVQIGEIVLRKACEAAMLWPPDVRVSVNISAIQFRDLNLAQKIASMLAHTGLPPTRLELEITEATLLSDDSDSLKTLNALRDTGVRIVIDDFGTGYSSLNYIRSFPFDKIKIDKSYVDELAMVSNKSNVILHSVLSMARHLELRTTAEGVETRDQMQQLRDAGCTELQGYYFNKPMAEKDVLAMFASAQEDDLAAGLSAIDRRTAV